MQIVVADSDWGDAERDNIEQLLKDVAARLTQPIRETLEGVIEVRPTNNIGDPPVTSYRTSSEAPYPIFLSARNKEWSKFAYQFSHELCHVISKYERLRANANNWFLEALCEVASMFTLRRMAEGWLDCPPYANWAEYSQSLASYAEENLRRDERQLPTDMTLPNWLLLEEAALRRDTAAAQDTNSTISDELRHKYAIVAYTLLPVFEGEPSGWNGVLNMPNTSGMLKDYLHEWHSQVEASDKPFVKRIMQLFEGKHGVS